ncbi:hypothetical protein Pan97_34510 [Bremerella volcania]|uniref:Uncharacterized protein n=1 Tax=Bremerella volcania TaxID=2527984 RepID=A0A518CAZ7_9BACT|nr:hypothetical protein [Bremerella volcania]QDU76402.1 hypothetical protein Pan97_34510 [Bremerella volcania]
MKRTQNFMKTKQPRRGALLLVVLSILVLFALVGLTFVVSALAFNTGAQANLESNRQSGEAPNEADAVMMQLLRGPRPGTASSILSHEILRDMWGNQSVVISGTAAQIDIDRPKDSSSNDITQFWEIEVDENVVPSNLFRIEQYYTGSVLTFTSGELKGQSHRILHYRMKFQTDMMGTVTQDGVVFVIDQDPIVPRENLVDSNGDGGIAPVDGDGFVVNDPPFNGTGLGFDPTAPTGSNKRTLSLLSGSDPVALLPNILYNFPDGRAGAVSIEAGGADEPYDAPDVQNMFLAYVDGGRTTVTADILPSFHRPDLVRYWFRQYIAANSMTVGMFDDPDAFMQNPDLDTSSWMSAPTQAQRDAAWAFRRKFTLRPSKTDHPNFTGSNANYDILGTASNARWDIDNDLDGIADSIWIDVGLPLKTDRQGRRYRPLAAIMVKDLDGLINVNTHGFYSQFASFEGTFPPSGTPTDATTLLQASSGMTNKHNQFSPSWDLDSMGMAYEPKDMQLALGSGYGPAEVSLRQIFTAQNAFDLMDARYKGQTSFTSTTGTPGQDATDDVRSRMDNVGLADAFNTTTNNRFGTPPDRLGLGRMYIDYAGRPRFQPRVDGSALTSQPTPGSFGQRTDDPYEFDPIHGYRYDTPFTYQELERVLRYEEYDSSTVAQSDDRLMDLAQLSLTQNSTTPTSTVEAQTRRRLITTASFQVPTANRVDIPFDLRDEANNMSGTPQNMMFDGKSYLSRRPAPTLVTLLQERLRQDNSWDPTTAADKKLFKEKIYQLLPPEIFRGEPFDLNRLLEAPADGNGTDDIFELQRVADITFQTKYGTSAANSPNSQFVNWLNGTTGVGCKSPTLPTPINATNPTSYSASRQLMARYLYVMVLLLMEPDYHLPTIDPSLTDTQKRELTQRRIAQWAINVVDFRDRDAVMTPFEYDLNPFKDDDGTNDDPWNVDGNLSTTEDVAFRRVVWGAEAPELVLSETLAFHDRRTKDTAWDDSARSEKTRKSSMMMEDPDLDQYRIPQGSLFIELYNPRNLTTNNNYLPPELYDSSGLKLDAKTPGGDPVWRIVITNDELDTSPAARTNILDEIASRPDTINFQPRTLITDTTDPAYFAMLDGDGTPDENYDIERIIWFCNPTTAPATTIAEPTKTFYYRGSSSLRIAPDGYSIIGPRKTTYLGSKPFQGNGTDPANQWVNEPGSQSIVLSGNTEGIYTFNNTQSPSGLRRASDTDFAVTAALPTSYANAYDPDGLPTGIGLSVTEPLPDTSYYPEPTVENLAPNLVIYDLYTDGDDPLAAPTVTCPDTPFDSDGGRGYPLSLSAALHDTGTHPDKSDKGDTAVIKDYKTAILQRLANPLSNHNAALNPYITVDHLGIDITVFNGEDSYQIHSATYAGAPNQDDWDPDESGDTDGDHARGSNDVYFASREKGRRDDNNHANNPPIAELEGSSATPSYSSGNYLGTLKRIKQITGTLATDLSNMIQEYNQTPPIHPAPVDTTLVAGAPATDEHFGRKLVHTMGYVNHNLGAQIKSAIAVNSAYQYSPLPLESGRQPNPYTVGTAFDCENNPLSYLNWPNAPYVSKYDLMMVPTSSPQRLLFEYSGARKNDTNTADTPFHFDSGSTNGDNLAVQLAPYAYLFNFFHGTKTDGLNPATPPANDDKAMQLVRLFDFVHVPSRFNGTNKWFDITQFNPTSGDLRNLSTKTEDARLGYMFPFNRQSEFREPGKINLNTIPSQAVYDSIFDPTFWQSTDFNFATWDEFKQSRRGYTGSYDTSYPSGFSNPFRPAAAAEMMPVLHGGDKKLLVPPEEAGLLRSVDRNASSQADRTPLFDLRLADGSLGNDKMRHYRTDDNPMLRYQAYQRLGNIAGTQSNVFAVWITIGYFEVEPVAVSPTHPDGWRLAEELGNDTGEINRHRAFYIIDRSIPVGYVPGEDLNVEDTIMLKRFIE